MKYILKLCKDTGLKQTGGIQRPMLRWVLSEPLLYSASCFSFSSVHGFEPASASDAEFGLARYLPFLYFLIPSKTAHLFSDLQFYLSSNFDFSFYRFPCLLQILN